MDIVRLTHPSCISLHSNPLTGPSLTIQCNPVAPFFPSSSNHPVSTFLSFSFSFSSLPRVPFHPVPSKTSRKAGLSHLFCHLVLGREQHVPSLEQGDKFETGEANFFYVSYVRLFGLKFSVSTSAFIKMRFIFFLRKLVR